MRVKLCHKERNWALLVFCKITFVCTEHSLQEACRSPPFQEKSVPITIKVTELRNRQCLHDAGNFDVLSLFSDTTHVAGFWNTADMSTPVEVKTESSPAIPSLIFHILLLLSQLWNIILEFTGHLLITKEEKGTVANFMASIFMPGAFFEGSRTSLHPSWEICPWTKQL